MLGDGQETASQEIPVLGQSSRVPAIDRVRRQTLVDSIADRLRGDILSGKYPTGTSLPPERELAARYAVNRTSLKHALIKLEHSGLIEIRHGVGSVVLNFDQQGGIELLPHLLLRGGAVDGALLEDLLDLRVMMGAMIAERAAVAADLDAIERLAGIVAEAQRPGSDPERIQALDMDFFRELADATGNRVLRLLVNSVAVTYLDRARDFIHAFRDTTVVVRGLQNILSALEARDSVGARRAAEDHLSMNSRRIIDEAPDGA